MLPKVSVIIPVYNAGKFLYETIESVINQTYSNLEIALIDDGSSDDSLSIARKFECGNVKVVTGKNNGAAGARNLGLTLTSGYYIQYLDADDILASDKIERQVTLLNGLPENTISSCPWKKFTRCIKDSTMVEEPVWLSYDQPIGWLIDSFEGGGMMQTACWLIPRTVAEKAGKWDESLSLHDDGEYFCRILLQTESIKFCEDAVAFYRSGISSSLSKRTDDLAISSAFMVYEKYKEHLLQKENSERVRHALMKNYSRFIYTYYPKRMDLMDLAFKRIKELGYIIPEIEGGRTFNRLSDILGFHNTLRLRSLLKK